MRRLLSPCLRYAGELAADMATGWNRFWFTPADPINLGMIRILTGLVLLWIHLTTLPDLLRFIGPHALLDEQAMGEMSALPFDPTDSAAGPLRSGDLSIWFYVRQPRLIWTLHGLFLDLGSFQAAMFAATLAFFPPDSLRRALAGLRRPAGSAR